MMYDIFRAENRASGRVDHIGEIEAPDEATALAWAKGANECRVTEHIYVREQVADDE